MSEGDQGPVQAVFLYVPEQYHEDLQQDIQEMCLEYDAQAFWRFLKYKYLPYLFTILVHPGFGEADRRQFLDEFFNVLRPCCLSEMFELKVREVWPTAEQLLNGGVC